eukprot:6146474-Amphidinium_carterae.1
MSKHAGFFATQDSSVQALMRIELHGASKTWHDQLQGVLEVLIVNAGIEPRFQASDERGTQRAYAQLAELSSEPLKQQSSKDGKRAWLDI